MGEQIFLEHVDLDYPRGEEPVGDETVYAVLAAAVKAKKPYGIVRR